MNSMILLLCLLPSLAMADIYKAIDADGHVTYSSAPIKGGKRVLLTPPAQHARARASTTPQDFPKVNEQTQRGRDGSRRKILEDELKVEEGLLAEATQNQKSAEGNPVTVKDNLKMAALSKQVELHQANINALKIELSKLK